MIRTLHAVKDINALQYPRIPGLDIHLDHAHLSEPSKINAPRRCRYPRPRPRPDPVTPTLGLGGHFFTQSPIPGRANLC